MNTATPRSLRRDALLVFALAGTLPLLIAACEILEVIQPSEADQGETIEVTVVVEKFYQDTNPHRGVVSVLVPNDWSYVSGTYTGDMGSGDMLEDAGWADSTEAVLPAPAGMKWIATISEEERTAEAGDIADVMLELEVGQQTGTFDLGYFTTINAFAVPDIDFGPPDDNSADTLMNVPITVNMVVGNEPESVLAQTALLPTYPNPARTTATVPFVLAKASDVRLAVYDLRGR